MVKSQMEDFYSVISNASEKVISSSENKDIAPEVVAMVSIPTISFLVDFIRNKSNLQEEDIRDYVYRGVNIALDSYRNNTKH